MQTPKTAVGGSWQSALTADKIVSSTLTLSEPRLQDGDVYWIESRPQEQGRQVIVVRTVDGTVRDMTPPPFSVRSRVHEYGGGAYTVDSGRIFFCNDSDGGIYLIDGELPARLLFTEPGKRFADLVINRKTNTLLCICEDHSRSGSEPLNSLVAVDLDQPHQLHTIAQGEDFYASPAVSPDGDQLAWISWSHPDMPWDRTALWLADVDNTGAINNTRCLLNEECSVFQPAWSPDNRLYFSCDRDRGWWNIFRYSDDAIENLCPFDGEFALPQWQFSMSTSGFLSAEQMLVTYSQNGLWHLATLCTHTGELQQIRTDQSQFSAIHARNNCAVLLASSPTELPGVYQFTAASKSLSRLATSGELEIDIDTTSVGDTVDFTTDDGSLVHGFFYRPKNARYRLASEELPPLIVIGHGGPTAATTNAYSVKIQFWTSRGFAVLDVNYRGSTGYGRAYRRKLNGQWGVADVADCVAGAQHLVDQGLVDGQRLIIRGSSAGGFTTLCALTFHNTFKAGASLYGIGDLETLVRDTHKFEAHYLDRLVGAYPESRELYRQRSPIHHIDKLKCPVIFLQGLQDRVVPPEQAQAMVNALQQKGVLVEYVTFENEQHGFRSGDSIKRALHEELNFYGKVFGFKPAAG